MLGRFNVEFDDLGIRAFPLLMHIRSIDDDFQIPLQASMNAWIDLSRLQTQTSNTRG